MTPSLLLFLLCGPEDIELRGSHPIEPVDVPSESAEVPSENSNVDAAVYFAIPDEPSEPDEASFRGWIGDRPAECWRETVASIPGRLRGRVELTIDVRPGEPPRFSSSQDFKGGQPTDLTRCLEDSIRPYARGGVTRPATGTTSIWFEVRGSRVGWAIESVSVKTPGVAP